MLMIMGRPANAFVSSSLTAVIMLAALSCFAGSARAQSLVEMYRAARFKTQAHHILDGYQARTISAVRLDYPTDSLREWVDRVFPPVVPIIEPEEPPLAISRWELVPKLGREWFRNKFKGVQWAYVGSNSLNIVDTTFTRELRARLQAEFGSPTQTIADLDHANTIRPTEYIQFEYWFVLNDSIPLLVMDVNGPFERGLVVASANPYQDKLPLVKEALLERIRQSDARAPYADYYYLPEQRMWFLTGYDGDKHYLERIPRPDLKLGRPLLDRVRN